MKLAIKVYGGMDKGQYLSVLPESKKPRIIWLCDKDGWAFWNNGNNLADNLPDYDHFILEQTGPDLVLLEEVMVEIQPDIVMIQHPWAFQINARLQFPMAIRLACRAFRVWPDKSPAFQF